MNETEAAQARPSAHEQVIQMAMAHQASSMVRVAAELHLADLLTTGPKTAEELAATTGTHAPSLYRFLRTASCMGLFCEDGERRFALTAMAEPLRSDIPGSLRTSVLSVTGPLFTRSFEGLLYSVQTGKTAFEKEFGMPIFEWLPKHPDEAAHFSDLMIGFHGPETAAVAEAYDFTGLGTLADVGGATGNMLTAILARYPGLCGVLFDLPHNAAAAAEFIAARGMTDRIRFQTGSFFEEVPTGADAYLMSHIIHDWSEEQCLTILGNCRRAMKPDGRLLIVEMVIPEGNEFHTGKLTDMIMLTAPGGQERTAAEYSDLLGKAGFRMERVVPTASAASVVEAFLT
ncbi:MAG: methyltransferase [Acidobacteriaceae bacterium]